MSSSMVLIRRRQRCRHELNHRILPSLRWNDLHLMNNTFSMMSVWPNINEMERPVLPERWEEKARRRCRLFRCCRVTPNFPGMTMLMTMTMISRVSALACSTQTNWMTARRKNGNARHHRRRRRHCRPAAYDILRSEERVRRRSFERASAAQTRRWI